MKIEKEQVRKDIKRVYELLLKPPTKSEYKKYGEYGVNTAARRFGSWNKALIGSIGEINLNRGGAIEKECSNCHVKITVQQKRINDNNFCSQSCAAIYNNKNMTKRKLTKCCRECNSLINKSRIYCASCIKQGKHLNGGKRLSEKTIREVLYKSGSNKYGVIRGHAKTITRNMDQVCKNCGYLLHVDTCHIKEIKDWNLDAKLSEVNHPNNLILLCKNCHWGMDHGKIALQTNINKQ